VLKRVPYPKEYSLVPYKKVSVLEEKAMIEIERIKQRKEEKLEKVKHWFRKSNRNGLRKAERGSKRRRRERCSKSS
jgi:hypothetical protein